MPPFDACKTVSRNRRTTDVSAEMLKFLAFIRPGRYPCLQGETDYLSYRIPSRVTDNLGKALTCLVSFC